MRSKGKKTLLAAVAALPLLVLAGPSASADTVTEGTSGTVMTADQMRILSCTKGGFGEAIGWARCTGTHKFKVRVWCTWGGSGLSDTWRSGYNWARCSAGSVHDEDDGIEIIWQ